MAATAAAAAADTTPPRRPGTYKPSMWDDAFIQSLSCACMEDAAGGRMEQLRQDVRRLLGDKTLGLAKQLELVDLLQRRGVGRHFDEEIHDILLGASAVAGDPSIVLEDDLSSTALLFRLLRQHGYGVTQDVFNCFKGAKGDFKACLHRDIRGALSLYEATHHAYKGETMLDAARADVLELLVSLASEDIDPNLREEVAHAVELPLNRSITRLQTRWQLDMCAKKQGTINRALHEMAVLDFNMVQSIHMQDLKKVSSWWMDLGLRHQLSFARDRIMENFFCSIGIIPDPQFSQCRQKLTQVCCLISTIDDVYDEYGTYDELQLFTEAVERWDINTTNQLPQYMKACYLALVHTIGQISQESHRKQSFDVLPYLKKAWVELCRSFLLEAKWNHDRYMPTFGQYMCNAWMSASVHVVLIHALVFMDLNTTEKDLEHLQQYPHLIRYSATLFRLYNDLVEKEGSNVPSSISCYMKENDATEEAARRHIKDLINETWSSINEEIVASSLPTMFIYIAMNVARTGHCLYQHGDGHSSPGQEFKNMLRSVLLEPIIQLKEAVAT